MMEAFQLTGQTAVITGGGTGLGRGIARCLVQAGAQVVLVGRREEPLREAAAEMGDAARWLVHDVTDLDGAEDLAGRIRDLTGPPHILVNNAGVHLKKPALETTATEMLAVMQTHLLGAHALTRALAADMVARGDGCVLFLTSMAAIFGLPDVAAYSAAKSACLGLVRALAVEWSPRGVRVNAIAPGWIESDMMRRSFAGDPQRAERILARTPMGRFGVPDEVGWAAVYLASPAGRFVTGQQLVVDGGVSVGF